MRRDGGQAGADVRLELWTPVERTRETCRRVCQRRPNRDAAVMPQPLARLAASPRT